MQNCASFRTEGKIPIFCWSFFLISALWPMFYDEDTVTDQPMRQIAAELIREKALRLLDDEIPHGIAVTIEKMRERKNGIMDIEASIVCERESTRESLSERAALC